MPLYQVADISTLPENLSYRIIADRTGLPGEYSYIETHDPVPGLDLAPVRYPNGVKILDPGCSATWEEFSIRQHKRKLYDRATRIFEGETRKYIAAIVDVPSATVRSVVEGVIAAMSD